MAVKIFFCYAHEDEALLNKLKSHLRPLQRQGLIDVWHDRDISAGTEWKQEIAEQLNSAQIILLLISPDFMNSDYCWSVELKRALERHTARDALVIPVILRPVHWQGTPFGELQALPKDGKAVTTWANRDEVLADVVEQIREAIQQWTGDTISNRERDQSVGVEKSGLTFAGIAIDKENTCWREANKFQQLSMLPEHDMLPWDDPYHRKYAQHFYLSKFVSNVDPSFDITLLNTTSKPVILTDVGIEIVSVAHTSIAYGFPQAVKVEIATSYTIDMPDNLFCVRVSDCMSCSVKTVIKINHDKRRSYHKSDT